MLIYTIKAHNLKLYCSIILSVLAVVLVTTLVPTGSKEFAEPEKSLPVGKEIKDADFKNIKSNEDRIAFLKKYGWKVEKEAKEVQQVIIPVNFDPIYEKYNAMQIEEGLDLQKYKGKTVKKYTYLVSNYEYDGTVVANLLLYKNRVIGGDISSLNVDGFVHGFTKGNDFLT